MNGRSWIIVTTVAFLLIGSTAFAAIAAKPISARQDVEPGQDQLPEVDRSWRERGWRAVVPHAFVLRKLLPIRTNPNTAAPVSFWLRGGTRVPVVEQGREWWKISWSSGRTGWAKAADLEPHAAVVLIDAHTGKMIRRIAAKGQRGAVSDGVSLWSIANTGITRTLLGERPSFWARGVAANREADFPAWSVWNVDRSTFVVRSKGPGQGVLLRTDVNTGEVVDLGSPSAGALQALTPGNRVLLTGGTDQGEETHLYDPGTKRVLRRIRAGAPVVNRDGIFFLRRGRELIRCGPDLRATARVRVPGQIEGVCLSVDQRYVAASYEWPARSADQGFAGGVRVFNAVTLKPVVTLPFELGSGTLYPRNIGTWRGGWWLQSYGEGMESIQRFSRAGVRVGGHESWGEATLSPDGKTAYFANDEQILFVSTGTGKARKCPLSWRRSLPAQFLPASSVDGFPTNQRVSSLTVSPDGKTLVLTEWLNGDPKG